MAIEAIIGGAVGAYTLYRWGWQAPRYVRAYVKRKRRADEFERRLREVREDAGRGCPYRVPRDGDRELLDLLHAAEGVGGELAACDFRVLGDLVVQLEGRPASGAVRAFVDRAGTTCALVLMMRERATPILRLGSWAGDRTFVTGRMPDASLAQPPSIHRAVVDAKLPHADMVARHRALAGDAPLRAIASRDELLAELVVHYDAIARWRASQSPDELLDADLRCVLGAAYARSGKAWARRLRGKLPEATLRRRSAR